jgi:RNA polymerase sigma factor (sigma-70 family)
LVLEINIFSNQPVDEILRAGIAALKNIYIKEERDIGLLIERCRRNDTRSQELLYRQFHGFAMAICRRYSRSREEALEIMSDGFYKILTQLDRYTPGLSFKGWIRRIMINSAIDHYRRNEKHYQSIDISYQRLEEISPNAIETLSEESILAKIQELPPSYRIVFNLHAIEGYSHEEISQKLGISVGTSKSNLSVARTKLMKMLGTEFEQTVSGNG